MGSNADPCIYPPDQISLFIARCFGEESGQSLESSARALRSHSFYFQSGRERADMVAFLKSLDMKNEGKSSAAR